MINLSQKFEYEIKGKTYTAYPLSLVQQEEVEKILEGVDEEKAKTSELAGIYSKIAYTILKPYNDSVTPEEIRNNFSLAAILKILTDVSGQKEIGAITNGNNSRNG